MMKLEAIGYISQSAEIKETPSKKEYAFFIVNVLDEKGKESFIKCFFYGCSPKRAKTLQSGAKLIVWGRLNLSLFEKTSGDTDININLNVDDIHLIGS